VLACVGTFNHPIDAVIVGTDKADGATTLKLPGYEVTRLVSPLAVLEPDKKVGSVGTASATTAPNHTGTVRVFANSKAASAGRQWVSSVGLAAVVASYALEMDVLDWVFTAETAQMNVDGPSASGLMTAAFLAAATGVPVDSDVTMTGTINPDGTIGPVGGIPEKFAAAIKQGKRTLGFPIGMRYALSNVSGDKVDLIKLAEASGARAVEIANVHQAYELITHKTLPEVVPVDPQDMHLDATTAAKLVEQTAALAQSMAQRWEMLEKLDADAQTPAKIKRLIENTRRALATTDALQQRDQAVAAHDEMTYAWLDALAASTLHTMLEKLHAGDGAGAARFLDALITLPGTDQDVFGAIAKSDTGTLGRQLRAIEANRIALSGWNRGTWAAPKVQEAKAYLLAPNTAAASVDDVLNKIGPVVIQLCQRAEAYAMARDYLALEPDTRAPASLASVSRSVTAFQAASAAAIAYLDSVTLPHLAEYEKLSQDEAKAKLAEVDPSYLFAHFADRLSVDAFASQLAHAWGDKSSAWLLLSLASAELGYTTSTRLVAERYALGVRGEKVQQEEAFAAMLEGAERAARAAARAARIATGTIPIPAKISYQLATASREGSTRDKLNALSAYWASSMYSQTAMLLVRHSAAAGSK
jgi:hypothetical protein